MFEQALYQLVARIVLIRRRVRIARQQHLALDVNQQRLLVDELGRNVSIQLFQVLDISEVFRRDLRDGDVVDVDVLFADQFQEQIERAVKDPADSDGKRELAGLRLGGLGRHGNQSYVGTVGLVENHEESGDRGIG